MASTSTTRHYGGGSKNHQLLQDGQLNQDYSGSTDTDSQKAAAITFTGFTVVMLLLWLLRNLLRRGAEEQELADARRLGRSNNGAGVRDRARHPPTPAPTESNGVRDRSTPSTVAVEAEPPLVCTYRRADGWREGSCGVCLSELADGEAVRVLPACMHCFHAECVGEWLRARATCPLCRAPLDPGPPACGV